MSTARFQRILADRLAALASGQGASTFGAEGDADFGAARRHHPHPKKATPKHPAKLRHVHHAATRAAAPAGGSGGGGDAPDAPDAPAEDGGGDAAPPDPPTDTPDDDSSGDAPDAGAETAVKTIAGLHTAGDLRDLLSAKTSEMNDLQTMRDNSIAAFKAKDAVAAADWDKDFSTLGHRFLEARAKAVAASTIPGPAGLVATDAAYTAVLKAIKQAGDPGPRTKGDLADLAQRLHDAGFAVNFRPPPQPTAGDADLNAFNQGGGLLAQVDPGLVGKPGLSTLEKAGIAGGIVALLIGGAYVYTMSAPLRRASR